MITMEEGEDLDDVLIEIEILKDTRHPNVVTYFNSYIDADAQELWVRTASDIYLCPHFPTNFPYFLHSHLSNTDRDGILLGVLITYYLFLSVYIFLGALQIN